MFKLAIPAALALAPAIASAQMVMDVSALTELEEVDILSADGSELGDVEYGLIGPDGNLAAVVVEVGGFLDIGDEDRVMPLDRLTWQDGNYVTDMTEEDIELLPAWDD